MLTFQKLTLNLNKIIEDSNQYTVLLNNKFHNLTYINTNLNDEMTMLKSNYLILHKKSQQNELYSIEMSKYKISIDKILMEINEELKLPKENNNHIILLNEIRSIKNKSLQLNTNIHHEKELVDSQNRLILKLNSEISNLNQKIESEHMSRKSQENHIEILHKDIKQLKKTFKAEKNQIIKEGRKIILELMTIISAANQNGENSGPIFEIEKHENNFNSDTQSIEDDWSKLRSMIKYQTNIVYKINDYERASRQMEENNKILALQYNEKINTLETEINDLKNSKTLAISNINNDDTSNITDPAENLSSMMQTLENINKILISKYPQLYKIVSLRNVCCVRGEKISDELVKNFFSSIELTITEEQIMAIHKFFESPLNSIELVI